MKMLVTRPARRWAAALAGLLLIGLGGCGGGGLYPVQGKLLYEDGQPVKELAGFNVTFTSQKLGKSSVGTIEEDGSFRMTTERPNDGVFPGKYQVIISQPHPNPERNQHQQPIVDLAYENPEQTDLVADVEPIVNEFTFRLRRIKKRAN